MPNLLVFAGPNGSGKSTITSKIGTVGEYVNADVIKTATKCSDMDAALIAERTREYLLDCEKDFTFETVLSTERNLKLMIRAKEKGYYITCFYVLTVDPQINVQRVKKRVLGGGHSVPENKTKDRWHKALKLLPSLLSVCDELYIFDNSTEREDASSCLIVKLVDGKAEIYSNQYWSEERILQLLKGGSS